MAIRKITFNSANVTAQNDSDFYNFLVGKNGILKGVRENAKATNNSNKITFQAGYVAIYGRLILIEKDTNITIPLTQNAKGYVVVSVNLALNNVELTYKEGSTNYPNLTQENLISNSSGVYELAICAYSKTTTSLTLDSNFTPEYINQKANNFYGKNNTGKMLKVGSDGYLELIDENTLFVDKAKKDANGKVINEEYAKKVNLDDHASNVENPHNVTKKQVGLEFVDNTSDANKPISILQQAKFEEISKDYNKKISDLSDNIDLEMQGKADLGIDGKIPTDQMPTTGITMDSAKKDGKGNIIDATYETKTDATSKLNKAKDHTTTEVSNLKKYTDEQFKKINDNLIATVDCSHKYEITGNTGDEHGLAIDDQQMLIKKIQGHSRRKSLNLIKDKSEYVGTVQFSISKSVLTINGTTNLDTTWFGVPLDFLPTNFVFSTFNTSAVNDCDILFMRSGTPIDYISNVPTNSVKKISNIESISIRLNGNGKVFDNVKIPIMINEGTTKLPFQPYDNTLVNSNNTLISTGRNLLDINEYAKGRTKKGQITNVTDYPKLTCSSTGDARLWNFKSADYYLSLPKGQYKLVIDNLTRVENYSVCHVFLPNNNSVGSSQLSVGKNVINIILETDNIIGIMSKMPNSSFNIGLFFKDKNNEYEYKQDIVQAPSLGEFDYYQEGKIYRQTSQVVTLNGSEEWGKGQTINSEHWRFDFVHSFSNVYENLNEVTTTSNWKDVNENQTWGGGVNNYGVSINAKRIYLCNENFTTVDQLKQWLRENPIQLVYKLATPTIEDYAMPSGYAVYNGGLQIQQGDVPYTITKQYNLSQKAQILANIEVDREQQKQINEVNNKIINLPRPSITNRTVKNISINNIFPQTLTPEQTKDVFNNDLFVILSVGGSQNFYEYKNVIENPSEGKTFINISPGMKDYVSENVSFDILYVASNGYIRKESFQINKFPVYQHSILITDEKDIRILCSIVAKKSRAISKIIDLKYLINASGLKVVCNGFVKQTLTRQGGMAFELNTQSGDVKVKYVNLGNSIDSIYDVALNSISGLKILDTVYDYTEANG